MRECELYKKLKDNKVQCQNCAHYCLIEQGQKGKCGVRENRNGKLYSLVYGKPCALAVDPIEKKPFYHFLPGTYSLSLATVGCNFACWNCQNWQISQAPKTDRVLDSVSVNDGDISPERVVKIAKERGTPSISYTYTEPAVFSEYALDIMKLAKKEGIKNNWVSNGFWSKELFELIVPPKEPLRGPTGQAYLDAANIDLKSFEDGFYQKYCGGRLQPVLDTLKRIKKAGVHLEITTLVIPTLNDSEEVFKNIANFIKNELGTETPWHISRFSGAISWKLQHIPDTPLAALEKAKQLGEKAGLKYVHLGNI